MKYGRLICCALSSLFMTVSSWQARGGGAETGSLNLIGVVEGKMLVDVETSPNGNGAAYIRVANSSSQGLKIRTKSANRAPTSLAVPAFKETTQTLEQAHDGLYVVVEAL